MESENDKVKTYETHDIPIEQAKILDSLKEKGLNPQPLNFEMLEKSNSFNPEFGAIVYKKTTTA